jgi:hypothetical protein
MSDPHEELRQLRRRMATLETRIAAASTPTINPKNGGSIQMAENESGSGERPDMNDILRQAAGRNALAPAPTRDAASPMNDLLRRAAGRPVEEPPAETEESPDA